MKKVLIAGIMSVSLFGWGLDSMAKEHLSSRLKDADSAKFKDVKISSDNKILCGYVNAKNSFGGYVGFKQFVSTSTICFIEDDVDASEWKKVWNRFCK